MLKTQKGKKLESRSPKGKSSTSNVNKPNKVIKTGAPKKGNTSMPRVSRKKPPVSRPQQALDSVRRAVNPPKRKGINRRGMTSVGVQGINYGSGYVDGQTYLDPGLGIGVGVRLLNAVGVELSYSTLSEQLLLDTPERLNRPLQGVGQLYLMPRQKLSPFVSAGIVGNAIALNDTYQLKGTKKKAEQESLLLGGVLGAGLEYNVSKNLGFKAEGRYLNYQNTIESQPAIEDALQISAGISVYF